MVATIQTYLSFLRGLAMWMNKPGFIRAPERYGLSLDEFQRHEAAQRDKSWSAAGIDVDDIVRRVGAYDRHVGASLELIRCMALRRKESVLFKPHRHVFTFDETKIAESQRKADRYVRIKGKGGRVRWIALDIAQCIAAVNSAQSLVTLQDGHLGHPDLDLKQNLRRFDYVLARFGITLRQLGATAHGLRHEVLIGVYKDMTGQRPPVQGGGERVDLDSDQSAPRAVSQLAGHARFRASDAYIGSAVRNRSSTDDVAGSHSADGNPITTQHAQRKIGESLGPTP